GYRRPSTAGSLCTGAIRALLPGLSTALSHGRAGTRASSATRPPLQACGATGRKTLATPPSTWCGGIGPPILSPPPTILTTSPPPCIPCRPAMVLQHSESRRGNTDG